MLGSKDLHDYQSKTADFIVNRADKGGSMCWLDVGSGKTVISIEALSRLWDNLCFNKCLVVSTKRIVLNVWPQELKLWEQTHNKKIVTKDQLLAARQDKSNENYVAAKKQIKEHEKTIKFKGINRVDKALVKEYKALLRRVRAYECKRILALQGDIYLINAENYRWLVNTLGTKWIFDTQIFDESSLFRNYASKRFKAAKSIRPYVYNSVLLTGTPAPNGYEGLWAQCFLIDGGERLGKNITAFRNRFFTKHYSGFGYVPLPGAHAKIRELIKDIVISLDPRDYMEIGPDPINEKIKLKLPSKLRKQYNQLEKDFFLEVLGDPIIAKTEANKANKLRQFCNGAVYSQAEDDENRKTIQIHDLKLQAVKEIVEISGENPIIVAYDFTSDKEKLLKAFPQAYTIETFDQEAWDRGEIKMLVVHPRTGGHGMNLQHGGHTVVWFPTIIDLELYEQLNGRVGQLRQAQSKYFKAPIYYHIYFEDTVEEDMIKRRGAKHTTQRQLIQAMDAGVRRRGQA